MSDRDFYDGDDEPMEEIPFDDLDQIDIEDGEIILILDPE